MFLLIVLLSPATYESNDGVAVFTSTPTLFTASSTTPVRLLVVFGLHHVDIVLLLWL